jgi:hypothetical protein
MLFKKYKTKKPSVFIRRFFIIESIFGFKVLNLAPINAVIPFVVN